MAVGGAPVTIVETGGVPVTPVGLLASQVAADGDQSVQEALDGKQPLDSDLTAIAALSTTAFGRARLTDANAAATLAALGQPQHNFTANAAPTVNDDTGDGYSIGSLWLWDETGDMWRCRDATLGAAKWAKIGLADHPGYIAARWYQSAPGVAGANTGGVPTTDTRLYPFMLQERITISDLGARVTTLSAGGNFRLGIYANNPATNQPTGTPLAQTGAMSTAAAQQVEADITGANVTLEPGMYWGAVQCDNTTARFTSLTSGFLAPFLIGGANLTDVSASAAAGITSYAVAVGYATGLPDMTGQAFTVSTNNIWVLIFFKVASVP